jgi:hypothetical protein
MQKEDYILREMGTLSEPDLRTGNFQKALAVYELCNSTVRTFSFERENKISELKSILK